MVTKRWGAPDAPDPELAAFLDALRRAESERDGAIAAGLSIRDADAVAAMRARATLLLYCRCGRELAFMTWPTRTRALLRYARGRGPARYRWADAGTYAANIECPRCRFTVRSFTPFALLAPDAGPDDTPVKFTIDDDPRGPV